MSSSPTTIAWDFPPLAIALRCLTSERVQLPADLIADAAVLFASYDMGSLPSPERLRSAEAWEGWLPVMAATYCERLVRQHLQMGKHEHLQQALQQLSQGAVSMELLPGQRTPETERVAAAWVTQMQRTAADHSAVLRRASRSTPRP